MWGGVAALFVLLAAGAGRPRRAWPRSPRCSRVALGALLSPRLGAPERFLWLLVARRPDLPASSPELVYVRDEFDGSDLYRMNTVFKLGYQAWLLLAVAAACALPWAGAWLPRRVWPAWAALDRGAAAARRRLPLRGHLRAQGRLRALTVARRARAGCAPSAPGDPAAIDWLRANTPGSAVVLEAVGEDYSAFGHARISTFTGRPTVLGWAGHELQWDHDPGSREPDVRTLYTTTTSTAARDLIDRYGVDYVVFGPIERTTYGDAGLAKWDELGDKVFDRDGTDDLAAAQTSAAYVEPLRHAAGRVPRLALR